MEEFPDILVKGGDYTDITTIAGHDHVLANGGRVEILDFVEGHSTTSIIERIHQKIGLSKKESAEMVEMVFGIMKNTLESGEKIKIAGFGNFVVKQKADRRGRNPQTGDAITISARRILTFKPSQVLKSGINDEE